jgi:transketolase
MAMAEKLLAAEFNRPGHEIVDHRTWAFLGDGCLMEGISHEACALAGTWGLGKLTAFWDDNGISIDGHVEGWFTDDTPRRFEAYGWQVIPNVNGHDPGGPPRRHREGQGRNLAADPDLLQDAHRPGLAQQGRHPRRARRAAGRRRDRRRPPAHGLGVPALRDPAGSLRGLGRAQEGRRAESDWQPEVRALCQGLSRPGRRIQAPHGGELPANWAAHAKKAIAEINAKGETVATRKASQIAINALAPALPEFVGGSADLTGSNLTNWTGCKHVSGRTPGNYISYGVREFGMSHIMNGMALHGGILPFGGTFLMFSEYARNALRMSALMKQRVIYVFTHDSIGLGEDGPTHQPVEQTATLRMIPNMDVWRPCDTVETMVAWTQAVEKRSGPSALCLSRQNLPFVKRDDAQIAAIARGGYVLSEAKGKPRR